MADLSTLNAKKEKILLLIDKEEASLREKKERLKAIELEIERYKGKEVTSSLKELHLSDAEWEMANRLLFGNEDSFKQILSMLTEREKKEEKSDDDET